jgi:activating signal cointegrator complex subunit 3
MLRPDRSLVERLFREGLIQVLVCTATLAWGVNLPAHTVVIKGTQLYDPSKGSFIDLGMLDVMQIFGRAGRPQYDTSGEGIIITSHDKLTHYLRLMTHQLPIESQFIKRLADHLNAEIVLGTVTNIQEAVTWLSYTYLFIRMAKNPWYYGIGYNQKQMDPRLVSVRRDFIIVAAKLLDKCQMIRYDAVTGSFYPTDLGRVASHYYIQYETISMFNEQVKNTISDADIFNAAAHASEFENITQRDEEMEELGRLEEDSCFLEVKGGVENQYGKVNILLQSYISQARVDSFSLVSDMSYIAQNASR